MPLSADFYNRLGLSTEATKEEIRKAFYKAAQSLHPDVNIEAGATELFLDVKEAYETLIDPKKREAYDGKLGEPPKPPVRFRTDFGQEKIPIIHETQLFYALIDIDPIPDKIGNDAKSSPPVNLSLVLDCSTSMQGGRINVLKGTAVEIIRQLREVDILSVTSFNDRAEIILSATNQANDLENESRIRSLQTRGGTEIYQGLKSGYSEIQKNLSPYYVNHLILVTDGHTYGDEDNCLELAREAAERNIGISCFGIGGKWNDTFLESLANITGGSCYYIREPKDIQIFLREKLNNLGQVLIEGIKLNFREGPGVQLNYAYRVEPEANVLPLLSPLHLGNISRKDKLSVILEFMILPIPAQIQQVLLLEGNLTYNIPENNLISQRFPVNLVRPTISITEQQSRPSKKIMEALSHLTLYRMQEEAKKELESGQYQEASFRLQSIGTQLLSQGETELADTAFAEANNIQNNKHYSEENQKRIKYGTQALILPGLTKE
jgi:Ca-activated chloride channel family protein